MDNQSQWLSIGQAAKYLGISRDTLRRWEKRGKIKAVRSPTNRRYYTKTILDNLNQVSTIVKPIRFKKISDKTIIFGLLGLLIAFFLFILLQIFVF